MVVMAPTLGHALPWLNVLPVRSQQGVGVIPARVAGALQPAIHPGSGLPILQMLSSLPMRSAAVFLPDPSSASRREVWQMPPASRIPRGLALPGTPPAAPVWPDRCSRHSGLRRVRHRRWAPPCFRGAGGAFRNRSTDQQGMDNSITPIYAASSDRPPGPHRSMWARQTAGPIRIQKGRGGSFFPPQKAGAGPRRGGPRLGSVSARTRRLSAAAPAPPCARRLSGRPGSLELIDLLPP